ncbi:hypothetical protein OEZ49_05280 [Ruegeria sp. WL0004]|uniref:Polysaccharide lyase family 7 protein n=1 Tax=Ruegeria marisflavi TaxID=2984152 RepID=A0ABT2WMP2_9RHOB|nr:hypothetical protein [Ruegeria sp. WL0004]MCU9837169.1 hypothetical protein [Ruegeria sp. WL0004]
MLKLYSFGSCLLVLGLLVFSAPETANASPLQTWKVSCGTDPGALVKKGRTYFFKTSSNHCPGGIFNQRSEIATDHMNAGRAGTYLFSTYVAVTSPSTEKFSIFQIHDGRHGCAPPLKINVLPSGQLTFDSEYKIGSKPGNDCRKVSSLMGKKSAVRIKRDGTEYKLDVVVDFDGRGGFEVFVAVDDRPQIEGRYSPPEGQGYFKSQKYFFKHGSYSLNVFPYTLVSRDMRVKRVKLKQ